MSHNCGFLKSFKVRLKVESQASTLNSHVSRGNVLVNPRGMCWLTSHFLIGKKCLLFMMLVGVRKSMWKRWTSVIHYFSRQAFFIQEVQQIQLQANPIFCVTVDQNVSCAHLPHPVNEDGFTIFLDCITQPLDCINAMKLCIFFVLLQTFINVEQTLQKLHVWYCSWFFIDENSAACYWARYWLKLFVKWERVQLCSLSFFVWEESNFSLKKNVMLTWNKCQRLLKPSSLRTAS